MQLRVLAPCALFFVAIGLIGCHRHHHDHHDDHHHHHYKLDVENASQQTVTAVQIGDDVHDVFAQPGESITVEGSSVDASDVTVIWDDGTRADFAGIDGELVLE